LQPAKGGWAQPLSAGRHWPRILDLLIFGLLNNTLFPHLFTFTFSLFTFHFKLPLMPSFDIVSEIERMEIENAVNQAVKELATRFDFKGSSAKIELTKPELITLTAEDANKLKGVREIMIGKLAKRGVDLRNVEQKDPAVSSIGNTRQEFIITQGLEGTKAKEITAAIKAEKFKVQASLQDRQVRVTGTKRDELQEVIAFLRSKDFGVALSFKNFRD
jgi:uncharacterized protein YajQ (UPF0234 family)